LDNPGYRETATRLNTGVLHALAASATHGHRRALDLGCGDGDLIASAKRAGLTATWFGVDLRPEVVESAAARHPDAHFSAGSADRLEFGPATFDIVVAKLLFSSLRSAPMEEEVANEIARVLKPEGWLVWLDVRYGNPTNRAVHGLTLRRLTSLFPGWGQELRSDGLLPPLARRLGRLTPFLHGPLLTVPLLRSHLVGRLQHP
jgi:ubiquinone/menaquinone biosynthesis C-methylase UbiE